MTREDKDLLFKDLCGRFPYEVKLFAKFVDGIDVKEGIGRLSLIDDDLVIGFIDENADNSFTHVALHEVKPYLFSLSSMTEEQNLEYLRTCKGGNADVPTLASFDWLNKNHFDYRGLIEKGLAIDATRLNIY